MDNDVLDLIVTINESSSSSYQKISDFCQNTLKVGVENAVTDAPESLRGIIQSVFRDLQDAMNEFCKMERYYMTHPTTWTEFYRTVKPPIDDTLEALERETKKQAFQQRQKVLIALSMEVIEALQDAQEFFERETRDIEQSATLLRNKMERLVQEAKAVRKTIENYPSLQKDPDILKRSEEIQANCLAVIRAGNEIYQRTNPQEPHPPLSYLFMEEAEGRMENFTSLLTYENRMLAENDGESLQDSWYLDRLEEYLPSIEDNTKKGREVFTLLLEGIQQEFKEALDALRGMFSDKRLLKEASRIEADLVSDLLDELAFQESSRKAFQRDAGVIAKKFEETARQAAERLNH